MSDNPPALLPPPEYAHLRWHWIDTPAGLEPWMWDVRCWIRPGESHPVMPNRAFACRYSHPCISTAIEPDSAAGGTRKDSLRVEPNAALAVFGTSEPIARTAADGVGSTGKTPGVAVLAGGGDRQSDVYYSDAWVKRLEARIAALEARPVWTVEKDRVLKKLLVAALRDPVYEWERGAWADLRRAAYPEKPDAE